MSKRNIDRREFLKRLGMTMGSAAAMMALEPLKAMADDDTKPSPAVDNRMTYRVQHGSGEQISLLGLGMMRMPRNDQELVNQIVDYALAHGVNYFDTAPMYGGGRNEGITGAALSRHPRDKYYIATKMSNYDERTWSFEASKQIYEKSFRELRVDYIDYYLLHGIGLGGMHNFEGRFIKNGFLDFLVKEREAARIRHLGFSYHGDVSVFDWLVDRTEEYHWDMAQIQMNYLDWRHASLNKNGFKQDADAEYLYDKLEKAGIQTVVMEPLRGSALTHISGEYASQLKALRPDASMAEWAFRWVGSHPNILTTLSGMNQMAFIEENVKIFSPLEACTDKENELLEKIADGMAGIPTIPCTTCAYCMPCPYGVDIPGNFSFYNDAMNSQLLPLPETSAPDYAERQTAFAEAYLAAIPAEKRASQCVDCEACLSKCPQQIRIPNQMSRIVESMRKRKIILAFFVVCMSLTLMSLRPVDEIITKENGVTVINTTSLAEDVKGYAGPTPLKIYIKGKKIEKIEALKNRETPKYFALIKRNLLTKWNGLAPKKATTLQVDAVTGATYSSEAVIENVKRGLNYYNKKGKK